MPQIAKQFAKNTLVSDSEPRLKWSTQFTVHGYVWLQQQFTFGDTFSCHKLMTGPRSALECSLSPIENVCQNFSIVFST